MEAINPKVLLAAASYMGYNPLQIDRVFRDATPFEKKTLIQDAVELGFIINESENANEKR